MPFFRRSALDQAATDKAEGVEGTWTRRKKLEMAWYALMTVVYFVYRSQEPSIFTPEAFDVHLQDLVTWVSAGVFGFVLWGRYKSCIGCL